MPFTTAPFKWAAFKRALARAAVLAVLAHIAGLSPTGACAGEIYIDYVANPIATLPSGVHSPLLYGWVENGPTGAGSPVINDAGLGINAWRVNDSLAQYPNPSYVSALSASATSAATNSGFRFEATARYVSDYGASANMGLSIYLNQRAYHLMLDLNATGDLQATLYGRSGATALTTGGTGAAGFHTFALESNGGTSVTALFDGRPIGSAWTGIAMTAVHANIVLWGNSNQSTTARGTMDFKSVSLELGPFTQAPVGDFNGDGNVNANDMLLWQRTLGSTTNLPADANRDGRVNAADLVVWKNAIQAGVVPSQSVIPEPEALMIVSASGPLSLVMRRRRPR
jgi:hypothetical protein